MPGPKRSGISARTWTPRGDAADTWSISTPPRDSDEPAIRSGSGKDPWRCRALPDDPGTARHLAVGDVLHADQRRLGPPEIAPRGRPREQVSPSHDPPVEVVRGKEHEVASTIAVRLHQVVFAGRHILVVAWEHDEVVRSTERARALDGLEVGFDRTSTSLRVQGEPLREREVIAEAVRDAAVEVRTPELHGLSAPVGVPGVSRGRPRRRRAGCRPAT